MNINMRKILTFIKHREFATIIGIGGVAALLSFIFNNENIFNYGIAFSSIGLISIGIENYLRKKDKNKKEI